MVASERKPVDEKQVARIWIGVLKVPRTWTGVGKVILEREYEQAKRSLLAALEEIRTKKTTALIWILMSIISTKKAAMTWMPAITIRVRWSMSVMGVVVAGRT